MSQVPSELSYTAEHEWVAPGDVSIVGITAHAAEELGDIVFVELPQVGDVLEAGSVCGEIESTKAVSEIYAPVSGEIVEINEAVVAAPETISTDPYGEGWLFKVRAADGDVEFLDAATYESLIA